jgi:predicted phage-related endonuclease
MNPLLREQQQQLTSTGGISLRKSQQEEQERLALQEFTSNPNNYMTNGNIDLKKAYAAIPKIAPLTGNAALEKLTTLATAQTGAQESKQKLTQQQRQIISDRMAILGRLGITDPQSYKNELQILQKAEP